MRLQPQRTSHCCRFDPNLLPPRNFIALPVDLAMMTSAEGNDELVADLAPQRPALGKTQMMRKRKRGAAMRAP